MACTNVLLLLIFSGDWTKQSSPEKKQNMQVNGDESGENQGVNLFTCSVFFFVGDFLIRSASIRKTHGKIHQDHCNKST